MKVSTMNIKRNIRLLLLTLIASGCSSTSNNRLFVSQSEIDLIQEQKIELQNQVDKSNADIERLSALNKQLKSAKNKTKSGDPLPPNAKAGECYARVHIPATYRTETQKVLKKEASYRIETSQPIYKEVTDYVLVKEQSEVAELIPAKYSWKTESILVKEAYTGYKTIPAVYGSGNEKILVKSAYTTWKKGRGPIEKVNNSTGEIMCLVEVPAEYKKVSSETLITPEKTEKVVYPAVFKDIKKKVMLEPPKMITKLIPAEYKTIKVKKITTPAQETRLETPAEYETVINRIKITDSLVKWQSILCETNTTKDVIRNLQQSLSSVGHSPGSIDGVLGSDTLNAVNNYQREKHLAVGQVTIETLKSLGVSY